jgi:hypothetical protein
MGKANKAKRAEDRIARNDAKNANMFEEDKARKKANEETRAQKKVEGPEKEALMDKVQADQQKEMDADHLKFYEEMGKANKAKRAEDRIARNDAKNANMFEEDKARKKANEETRAQKKVEGPEKEALMDKVQADQQKEMDADHLKFYEEMGKAKQAGYQTGNTVLQDTWGSVLDCDSPRIYTTNLLRNGDE